jgi:two-component system NarL family response regulator
MEEQRREDPIRVLIADDHELFRRGLKMVLEAEEDIDVVAETEDGAATVTRVGELAPDVVLMDVRMPRMNGIAATREIREEFPATRILMLTVSDDEDDLFDAVKAGANGYLLKEISIEEVADAVRAVAEGRSLLSPSMAAKLLSEFAALARQAADDDASAAPRLTSRELEVLKRVAVGLSNEEIAAEMGITESTVRNHVANILAKLQLRSRMEAAIVAIHDRLVDT